MHKILITGAGGTLGGYIARHWQKHSYSVTCLTRSLVAANEFQRQGIRARLIDPQDEKSVASAVTEIEPDVILHTACCYGRQKESLAKLIDVNVRYGLNLLAAIRSSGAQVIFINCGTALDRSVNNYALSKTQFVEWAKLLCEQGEGPAFVNLQLQSFYGPSQAGSDLISRLIRACQANDPFIDLTSGVQKRDFIHMNDVASALDLIIAGRFEKQTFYSIDVGTGEAVEIRQVAQWVRDLTGASTELRFGTVPYRPHEPMISVADTRHLGRLGWKPVYNLYDGLYHTISQGSIQ